MAKYAMIENGIIVNTIESGASFAARIGAVALPEGFIIGDGYRAGEFISEKKRDPIEAQVAQSAKNGPTKA